MRNLSLESYSFYYNHYFTRFGSFFGGNTCANLSIHKILYTLVDAPYDVCPANWRMPTVSHYDDSDYGKLRSRYADSMGEVDGITFLTDISATLSGHHYPGSNRYSLVTSYAYYWSSTYGGWNYNGSYYIWQIHLDGGRWNSSNYTTKDEGLPVRCILKPWIRLIEKSFRDVR